MHIDRNTREAEHSRELNALCGLVHFARERCYPDTLIRELESLLAARLPERRPTPHADAAA